jgi:hypothetical protein
LTLVHGAVARVHAHVASRLAGEFLISLLTRTGAPVRRIRAAEENRYCDRSRYSFISLTRSRSRFLISRRKVRLFLSCFKFWCFRRRRSQFAHVHSNSGLEGSTRCPQLAQMNQSPALCRAMALNSEPSAQWGHRTTLFFCLFVSHFNNVAPTASVLGAAKAGD